MTSDGAFKKRISVVGRRIRSMRISRNMSIEDLSKKTSVSSVTISNIEKGIYSPKLSTILEITKALGTTITFLIEDVDEPRIFKIDKDKQLLMSTDGVILRDFNPVIMDKQVSVYIMEMERGVSLLCILYLFYDDSSIQKEYDSQRKSYHHIALACI